MANWHPLILDLKLTEEFRRFQSINWHLSSPQLALAFGKFKMLTLAGQKAPVKLNIKKEARREENLGCYSSFVC
jgi:hypothetical protein